MCTSVKTHTHTHTHTIQTILILFRSCDWSTIPPRVSVNAPSEHTPKRPTQTIDFVRTRLKDSGDEPPLSKTCGDLCDACCADTADGDGTGLDNVTAVIVQLNTEGARALMHGGSSSSSTGTGTGDMDTSDDGKRKQGGGGGEEEEGRTKKQMKAAEEAAAAAAAAAGGDSR